METLAETRLFHRLQAQSLTDPEVRRLVAVVERVFSDCTARLKAVVRYMPQYTLHDEVHLLRVVDLMGRLVPDDVLSQLEPLELGSLILVAALHDIGMAPAEEEVRYLLESTSNEMAPTAEKLRYQAVRQSHPEMLRRQGELRREGHHNAAGEIEAFFLSEYIRATHANRSRQYVFESLQGDLRYRNFAFTHLVADVCFSHTQPIEYLNTLPIDQLLGGGEYANFRFIAVLLRLADILDFDAERTPPILFQQLGVRDAVSILEWRKHSAIAGWDVRPDYLAFTAQCPDPVIEKSIRDFIEMMEREVRDAGAVLRNSVSVRVRNYVQRYNLPLPTFIDKSGVGPQIGPHGPIYTYIDVGFVLDQPSIQALLMGVNLYAQPFLFLREMLQNAVDTCRHRAAIHRARPELGSYAPEVSVRLIEDGSDIFLEVSDNGMGMNESIIRHFFARVGVSYYRSPEFLQQLATPQITFKPVSQFGIGVLSVFMVTEKLSVDTMRFGDSLPAISIEIAGKGELFWFRRGTRTRPGTALRLRVERPLDEVLLLTPSGTLNRSVGNQPSLLDRLVITIAEVAPNIEFPILVAHGEEQRVHVSKPNQIPDYYAKVHPYLRFIHLDLTRDAPDGLNGACVVMLMQEAERFVTQVPYAGDCYRRHSYIQVIPEIGRKCEYLSYGLGAIHKQTVECKASTDTHSHHTIHGSGAPHIFTEGRWSQQGFAVPYPIFAGQSGRYGIRIPNPAVINFPFPIWFDVDLAADFVLPLSADRQNVLSTTASRAICARIAGVLFELLLDALGREEVEASIAFFRELHEWHGPDRSIIAAAMDAYGVRIR